VVREVQEARAQDDAVASSSATLTPTLSRQRESG